MPTIAPTNDVFTLVNVFTVPEENQQELVDLLVEATRQTMQHLPGFVSANIHVSHDGTRVVNYAQWEPREHFEAMREREAVQPHMRNAAELADSYDPITCDLVDSTPQPT
ncbi:MAG: antibiotic biosynthesis monooxygenase [Salinibacter sp.]